MRLHMNLHTPLRSLDILAKGASVNCPMTDGLMVGHRGSWSLSLSTYFIPLSRTQCTLERLVWLKIAINLQADYRSILPLIFLPTIACSSVPFPAHTDTTLHNDTYTLTDCGLLNVTYVSFSRRSAHAVRNQTPGAGESDCYKIRNLSWL